MLLYYQSEIFSKTLPALIFLITALVRYYEIQPIGFSKTTIYSKMFKSKMVLQCAMIAVEIGTILLYFVKPADSSTEEPIDYIYEQRWLSLILVVNIFAWVVGASLMNYEYKKRLSEAFYTHWFYWSVMLLNDIAFMILNFSNYVRQSLLFLTP